MTPFQEILLARLTDCDQFEDLHETCLEYLKLLPDMLSPEPLCSEHDYGLALKARAALVRLDVYTQRFQEHHAPIVQRALRRWEKVIADYDAGMSLKSDDARLVARYLLWTKHFTHLDPRAAFLLGAQLGVLARHETDNGETRAVVIGLKRAVGDNVFTEARNGRQFRQYREIVGRQAFWPVRTLPFTGAEREAFLASLPALGVGYSVTGIGDSKWCARPSAFDQPAIRKAYALLEAVNVSAALASLASPSPPPAAARPEPVQLDWVAA